MISKYQRLYLTYHIKECFKTLPLLMKTASTSKDSAGSVGDFLGITFIVFPIVIAAVLGVISLVGALIFWPLPGIPTWSIGSFIWTTSCFLYFMIILPLIFCYFELSSAHEKETSQDANNFPELRHAFTNKLVKKIKKLSKAKKKLEADKEDFETLKTEFNQQLKKHPDDKKRITPGKQATVNSCKFLDDDIKKLKTAIAEISKQKAALEAKLESSFEETLKAISYWKGMIQLYKRLGKKGQKFPHIIGSYKRDIDESIIDIDKRIEEL